MRRRRDVPTRRVQTRGGLTRPRADGGAAPGYGAVFDPASSQSLTRSPHDGDGSPVFSTSAPSRTDRSLLLLHGVGNDGSIFGPIMPSLAGVGTAIAPTLSPALLTDVGSDREHMSAKLVDWLAEICPPPWN